MKYRLSPAALVARTLTAARYLGRVLTGKIEKRWKWRNDAQRCPGKLRLQSLGLVIMTAATAGAQQSDASLVNGARSLPDAPLPQGTSQTEGSTLRSTGASATVTGVVRDTSGAAIPEATVSLIHKDGSQVRATTSGPLGEFAFRSIPRGSYLIAISARGFARFTSQEFDLAEQQVYVVFPVELSVAAVDTEITVRPTEVIAAEQIKAEEKQRLFGVMPNFYVSYIKDAAPLTAKQKFSLASHDTLDYTSWIGISITAGLEQANNTYAGYGQGAAGYGKRWAAQFADGRTSDYLSRAVFPSLFHQDPRYFYQGTGTTKSRIYHAVSNAWAARGDNGKTMPNYSYLLGAISSGALSNLYYPHADRGVSLLWTTTLIEIGGRAGANLVQEFLGKRVTTNVPVDGRP